MRTALSATLAVLLLTFAAAGVAQENPLKCVQRPIAFLVGQQTRIVIETPPDCGELAVTCPRGIELFDRWPHRAGDTQQRFYLRAKAPLADGKLSFASGQYALEVPLPVLTWEQARQPRQFEGMSLPRVFPLEGTDEHKAGPTFLTKQELAVLRQSGMPNANTVADALPPDEKLVYAMGESTIPRTPFVQSASPMGCPVCGKKIFQGRSPFYPWIIDTQNHPWKVGCPECQRWFPSNDFAAGDMHSGEFPDDGWGYFKPGEKLPYAFIAYYNQWSYHGPVGQQPGQLAGMYARSGHRRLGRAAALVFFRLAEQYFNLAVNVNQRKSHVRNAVAYGTIPPQTKITLYNTWFFIESNWEVPYVAEYARAFDMLWDYFDQEDPALLAFLQSHNHPDLKTMADVRNFIELGYFRTVAQGCLDRSLIGNLPQGQMATMQLALALNTPRSFELVDWVFNKEGGMRYFLTNDYFIDGSAFESQGYNAGHVSHLEEFAQVFERVRKLHPDQYAPERFPTLTADPKYRQIFDFCLNFNLIGRMHAQSGDCGDVIGTDPLPRHQTTDVHPQWFVGPYSITRDPRFAMVLYDPTAHAPLPAVTDPELRAAVEKVVAERGANIEQASNLCDGYGHAILRSGRGDDRRAVWLRYGRSRGHQHDDMLTIGFEAKQRKLLPELGYPHFWEHRYEWESNWATHYCVRVIGGPYEQEQAWKGPRGHCRLFADGSWARVATAYEATHRDVPAPEVHHLIPEQIRERTLALIDLDERDSYVLDIVAAGGGTDNYWSFHGPRAEGDPRLEGLETRKQATGTLAGPDITYGQGAEWVKANPFLSAFPFLYDVARGQANGRWSRDWALQKHPDLHLRMTALTGPETEVALAKGKPPGGGLPYELQWAVLHTSGPKPHYSQFVDVQEVYQGTRRVTDIKRLPVSAENPGLFAPVALQVTAGDRVDTIIVSREAQKCEAGGLTSDGLFAVWSERRGQLERAYLVGGRALRKGGASLEAGAGEWRGTITQVDYRKFTITVAPAASYPAALVGRTVRLTNEFSDCSHLITAARNVGDATELKLEFDPRIAEGPVDRVSTNWIASGLPLLLTEMRYCHGKTLSNEDGSATYRMAGVVGQHLLYVDRTKYGDVPGEKLEKQFGDLDGDGIKRFLIYDYGIGDTACVTYAVSLERTPAGIWRLQSPVPVTLALPGQAATALKP